MPDLKYTADEERLPNPFWHGWRRYRDAEHDFRYFKQRAEAAIEAEVANIPNFAALKAYTGFVADMGCDTTVQASFGHRPMGRRTYDGKTASEEGASLVYSFGPTGWVSVMLYPAKSNLGRVLEDHVYLRIGRISAARLFERLPKDLRDLVRYERVTSMDVAPRFGERLRIGWLRYWSQMQVNGQTRGARSNEHLGKILEFSSGKFAMSLLSALLRPIAAIAVALLLIRFGMPELIKYVSPDVAAQKSSDPGTAMMLPDVLPAGYVRDIRGCLVEICSRASGWLPA